jgi:DUF2934 family protein
MPNLDEAIRERAYHLWLADGGPEGKADTYWLTAQHEILAASVESSAVTVEAVPTKPARKTKAARSDKARTRAA